MTYHIRIIIIKFYDLKSFFLNKMNIFFTFLNNCNDFWEKLKTFQAKAMDQYL